MQQKSPQHIHCIVSNCHYWENGNSCQANEILVTSDAFGSQQPDRVDATTAKSLEPTVTSDCMSTCCKTFVEKGSGKIQDDGITRMS